MSEQRIPARGVQIGEDCWLGAGVVVVDGVRIGRGTVVAAGATVTEDIPPMSVAGGVPARVLGERDTEDGVPEGGERTPSDERRTVEPPPEGAPQS